VRLRVQITSLRATTPMQYAQRFLFGGLVTVVATLIADKWGPVVGGMFLAFPGIFPAGVSLVEEHKTERESQEGKVGVILARGEASVEATGASAGTWGLAAFGLVIWKESALHSLPVVLACAGSAWVALSWTAWMVRDRRWLLTWRKRPLGS
jgi:hypothetical protein